MSNYLQNLLEQFQNATGFKEHNLDSDEFETEFAKWIEQMELIGGKYTDFLSFYDVDLNNDTIAEVGKGGYDSVVRPFETKIITEAPSTFNSIDKSRLLNGKLLIERDGIYLLSRENGTLKVKKTGVEDITTLMTQNPINFKQIDGWDYLHNHSLNNVLIGLFGNTYDNDYKSKLEILKRFKKFLESDSFREHFERDKDTYFYMIETNPYAKKKSKLYDSLYNIEQKETLQRIYLTSHDVSQKGRSKTH